MPAVGPPLAFCRGRASVLFRRDFWAHFAGSKKAVLWPPGSQFRLLAARGAGILPPPARSSQFCSFGENNFGSSAA